MAANSANTARGLLCVSLLSDRSVGPPLPIRNTPGAASYSSRAPLCVCSAPAKRHHITAKKTLQSLKAAALQTCDVGPQFVYLICASLLH